MPLAMAGSVSNGYTLSKSLRFRSSASAYLNRTFGTPTSATTWTISTWVKRGTLGTEQVLFGVFNSATDYFYFGFDATNVLQIFDRPSGGGTNWLTTTQVFRDPAAWYHIVYVFDTTQATSTNRQKLYINGVQVTSFSTQTPGTQNSVARWNANGNVGYIGRSGNTGGQAYIDMYQAELNFIDGQALTPSSFGFTDATTGVWQPNKYAGTYGTNGFYLPFTNITSTTTLGYDFSGNSNNWTTNNLSLTTGSTYDSMTDVPTLTNGAIANYCVLNPLNQKTTTNLVDGNLKFNAVASAWQSCASTIAVSTGKWYWEVTSGGSDNFAGITSPSVNYIGNPVFVGDAAASYSYYGSNGQKYTNSSGASYGATYSSGDIIGVAFDATNGTLEFYKNGTTQGVAFTGISGTFCPAVSTYTNGTYAVANFGQRPFTYTPPTGFVALNTYNLPTSTIVKGNTVMDATTYAGTSATQSVTNTTGFKPDFIWIKNRTGANDNILFDSNRGSNGSYYYELISNGATAENYYTAGNYGMVSAINSNGFTLASSNSNWNLSNATGNNYVGWQWQAGQGSSSSNTSGSITSTVSVNATAGFSVVTYTGTLTAAGTATVGHGLGVAPSMIIFKARNAATSWPTFHTSLTSWNYSLFLDLTNAQTDQTSNGSMSAPTSTVFSTNWTTGMNISGNTQVAYCFAPIAGYSAFGSYTGNSSTDGPFVYLGFRPRFVMVKASSGTTGDWLLLDTSRDSYNMAVNLLNPNVSDAEAVISPLIDILSNGFKIRRNSAGTNGSGNTYIYMAFAENPFKNALAR